MNTNETTWKELKDEYPTFGDEWQANDGAWHPVLEPKTSTARQFHPIKFRRPIAPTSAPATSETPMMDELANQLCAEAPPIGDLPAWKDYMVELVKKITFAGVKLERELTAATRRAEEAERRLEFCAKHVGEITANLSDTYTIQVYDPETDQLGRITGEQGGSEMEQFCSAIDKAIATKGNEQ